MFDLSAIKDADDIYVAIDTIELKRIVDICKYIAKLPADDAIIKAAALCSEIAEHAEEFTDYSGLAATDPDGNTYHLGDDGFDSPIGLFVSLKNELHEVKKKVKSGTATPKDSRRLHSIIVKINALDDHDYGDNQKAISAMIEQTASITDTIESF